MNGAAGVSGPVFLPVPVGMNAYTGTPCTGSLTPLNGSA